MVSGDRRPKPHSAAMPKSAANRSARSIRCPRCSEPAALVHQPEIEFGRSVGPKIAERFVVCGIHPVARNGHVHPGHAARRSRHNGIGKFDAATKTFRLYDVFVAGIARSKDVSRPRLLPEQNRRACICGSLPPWNLSG